MARVIIVTAADANYASLAEGLIASIRATQQAQGIAIGFLDVGLEAPQRERLRGAGAVVVEPGWDHDFSAYATRPKPFMRAHTARPHLPRYFPGFDLYLHMDADTWLQDWRAIELYLSAAQERGLALAPEVDRSYSTVISGMQEADLKLRLYRQYFVEETARRLTNLPILNSGVFAVTAASPFWGEWQRILGLAYDHLGRSAAPPDFAVFYAEQSCLNAAVRSLGEPAALLPAWCNWMCHRALPRCSEDGTVLYEPNPPYRKLGIVHLTSDTKNGRWELRDLAGKAHTRSLRYRGG